MPFCSSCNRQFLTQIGLETHQTVKSHCYCARCDRFFIHEEALTEHDIAYHKAISNRYACQHCKQCFVSNELCKQHQRSTEHCCCLRCDRFFKNQKALDQHMRDSPRHNAFWAFQCNDCPRTFENQQAMDKHLRKMKHAFRPPPPPPTSLQAQAACANVPCASGSKCDRQFASLSSAIRHLESGTCPSGINRHKIFAFLLRTDKNRLITSSNPSSSRTIPVFFEDSDTESDFSDEDAMSTPSTASGILLEQCSRAMAHLNLKDHTCTECTKTFRSLKDLENHTNSPVHLPKLVHCDLPSNAAGFKTFRTLSDLVKHIESGACKKGQESLRKGLGYVEKNLAEIRKTLINY